MVMPNTPPPQLPVVLRGSVVTRRRRCGKPNCRCADGVNLHESPALSYSVRGRTRILLLEEADVASVRAAVERYRDKVAALDAEAEAGLARLDARVRAQQATGRRRRR
jgi:hypothetical protein